MPCSAIESCTRAHGDAELNPFDRLLHAEEARFTASISPASLLLAFLDWALHLANAPGHGSDLAGQAVQQWGRLWSGRHPVMPLQEDHRFGDSVWSLPPFNIIQQSFLLCEEWWRLATDGPPGVARSNSEIVSFTTRQMLDVFAPSNCPMTNPEVLRATMLQYGWNYIKGFCNFMEDYKRLATGRPTTRTEGFKAVKVVAATPGKVVLRNDLMELIQYLPETTEVRPEPVLIVPAWIMKYYILDLSPTNSLVRYLVARRFTVFCISWRNPGAEMRDVALDDYRRLGVMAAVDAVCTITEAQKLHACGYCLGGTLLAIAAAAMARDHDDRLATTTLLAAQADFTEAGELQLFTNESQLAFLDDVMWRRGYLDSTQMAGAFQLLRSNDLVWSRIIKTYLLGERDKPSDLMAWNADATRMPYRMHSEYLRRLFLRNDLAEGRYLIDGRPVAVSEIDTPIFAVGTETDHVAPWRSVFKIHLLSEQDITFVLTSGGHNAGIVSEPGHRGRHYRIGRRADPMIYIAPETWRTDADLREGSWWPAWFSWLESHSGNPVAPPSLSALYPPLGDAPGDYVREP